MFEPKDVVWAIFCFFLGAAIGLVIGIYDLIVVTATSFSSIIGI